MIDGVTDEKTRRRLIEEGKACWVLTDGRGSSWPGYDTPQEAIDFGLTMNADWPWEVFFWHFAEAATREEPTLGSRGEG